MFGFKIISKKRFNEIQEIEFKKGYIEGQLSVVKSNVDGTKAFILGSLPDKQLIQDVNEILNNNNF